MTEKEKETLQGFPQNLFLRKSPSYNKRVIDLKMFFEFKYLETELFDHNLIFVDNICFITVQNWLDESFYKQQTEQLDNPQNIYNHFDNSDAFKRSLYALICIKTIFVKKLFSKATEECYQNKFRQKLNLKDNTIIKDIIFYLLQHLFTIEKIFNKELRSSKGKAFVYYVRKSIYTYFYNQKMLPETFQNELLIINKYHIQEKNNVSMLFDQDFVAYSRIMSKKCITTENEFNYLLFYSERIIKGYTAFYQQRKPKNVP